MNAFKNLNKIVENIKKITWPIPVVELEDGSHIKPYKIFGNYIFDHEPAYGKELLNSIEINSSLQTAKISSSVTNTKGTITKSVKGSIE